MSSTKPAVQDIQIRFAEFANVASATIQYWIDLAAASYVDQNAWGQSFSEGVILWVAHNLALSALAAAQGGVAAGKGTTSERVDSLSVSYSGDVVKMQADDPLMLTLYGQQFVRLRSDAVSGAVVGGGLASGNPNPVAQPLPYPLGGPPW